MTAVEQPFKMLRRHQRWVRDNGGALRGRVYLSTQGINAQYSGEVDAAHAYAQWVGQQPGFEGLRWSSQDVDGHQFPRMRLQFKPNLVSLAGGMTSLPVTEPQARATPLAPGQWREMLRDALPAASSAIDPGAGAADPGEGAAERVRPLVLDVRNAYEWDAGHFQGAERPLEDHFAQTPTEARGGEVPAPLRGRPEDTPVMMYCTGGIRCDIYSTYLRQKGFTNLYTLEGGVHAYMRWQREAAAPAAAEAREEEDRSLWNGSLFVFDNRMAIPPSDASVREGDLPAAAACALCGGGAHLPHLNCANLDCNRLFLACNACKVDHRGCCCEVCLSAPRLLRAPKAQGYYGLWHAAAAAAGGGDGEVDASGSRAAAQAELDQRIAAGRGNGRLLRRRRRRERLRAEHSAAKDEALRRRRLINEAMERREACAAAEPAG
ncbi:hypothetical protein WJX81_002464 [Elliptochloris bilobata]|uniref:Rhodanese domain-containing protein n=1 Tax=Elliptochloris bilobata TaxID=381761 RepID=A0AAW1SG72_9CHLO